MNEVVVRQNNNNNADVTAPYRPAQSFTFHRVMYFDHKGNEFSFVCSAYQIKEQMITFYDIRIKETYWDESQIQYVCNFYNPYDSYIHLDNAQKPRGEFHVYGYRTMDCKTIGREKVIDIDSFTVTPSEQKGTKDWYDLDKTLATEQSAMLIESYNERVVKNNALNFSKENVDDAFDKLVEQSNYKLAKAQKRKDKDDFKEAKDNWEQLPWYKRWFTPKPVHIDHEPVTTETPLDYMLEAYEKVLKKWEGNDLYTVDTSYIREKFGLTVDAETNSNDDSDIIEAEYEEVE